FGWRVQGTYRIAGDARAPEYQLTNTGLRENNLSLGLGWQREAFSLETYYSRFYTELGILRSAHIGNLTDLQAALASGEPQIVEDFSYSIQNPRQQVVHDLFKLRGNWQLGNAGALEAQYGLQRNHRQEFDIRRGDRSDIPALDLELTTHNQEIVFTHRPWWDRWKGSIGLTGSYNRNRNVPGTGTKPLIPWYNNLEAGLFWVEKWLQEKYELEFGLRYDHRYLKAKTFDDQQELVITRLNYQGFTASLGGRYHLTERWTLRLNLGTAIRPPNVSELFSDGLHHAIASIEEGNVDLSPERSAKAVLNLTHENDDRFRLELDGYYQLIDRYIFLQPEPELRLTIRGAFPVFTYRQTDATLAGFDAYVQFRLLSHLFLEGKGSLVRGFDRGADDDLIFLPPPRGELHLKYVLAAAGRVKDLQFDLGVRRSWEQKHFPEGVDFVPPPSAYTLLTAGFSMNYLLGAHPLGIHLRIDNLLDTPYREYLNRLRYYADEAGRNVELRLSYEF
ncbi:MAG: TonB-dependent receptor, partial [Saprospiraceae bacterium]|nr:TonB-dependent receptor [Saprospiraceae bacterium]